MQAKPTVKGGTVKGGTVKAAATASRARAATRSQSPLKPRIKKEHRDDLDAMEDSDAERIPMMIDPRNVDTTSSDDEIDNEGTARRIRELDIGDFAPKPYPVSFSGRIPKSIEDADTPENLHRRRHCAYLFNGEHKWGKDRDGIQECMLLELPALLPIDRDKLLAWKAKEKERVFRGDPPVEYESDDDRTDEEKKRAVDCCTPADLEGCQVGEIRCYEDGYVEYICGGVRFEVTEGTKVIDRQDVLVLDENKPGIDGQGRECSGTIYPMFTVTHRVTIAPKIDELL